MSVIVLSNAIPDGSLNGGITNVATSLTVQTGEGATFPTVPFKIGINSEAMLVTAKATDTFTVTRGYDGTTAAAHADTDVVKHVFTAEDFPTRKDDTTGAYHMQDDLDLDGNSIVDAITVPALILLDSYIADGTDVCTFTGIPADCEGLKIVTSLRSDSSTDTWEDLGIRMGDGSIDTGSNYYCKRTWGSSAGDGTATYFVQPSGASPGNAADDQLTMLIIEIAASYADASYETQAVWLGGRRDTQDDDRMTQGYGNYLANNVVDQISLFPLNGTYWEAGTVKLYGYRDIEVLSVG